MLSGNEIKILLMLNNRNDNPFFRLPKELIINNIVGANAENALKCMIQADYRRLFFILSARPHAMFEKAIAQDIDGQIIEKSPLAYALYYLDSFAWNICFNACKNNLHYFDQFKLHVSEARDCVDLKFLCEAYMSYFDSFDQHKNNLITKDALLGAWLKVGKAQLNHLPRHMLVKMCMLAVTLQPATHDLILIMLPSETSIDNKLLNGISKRSHYSILIKMDDSFIFCKFNFVKKNWSQVKLKRLPFVHLSFPQEYYEPKYKKYGIDYEKNFQFDSSDYWDWRSILHPIDHEFYIQDPVFLHSNNFERLLPLTERLGVEFALARGAACICFSVSNPTGDKNFLKMKSADDLKVFQGLVELGILERKELAADLKMNAEAGLSASLSK